MGQNTSPGELNMNRIGPVFEVKVLKYFQFLGKAGHQNYFEKKKSSTEEFQKKEEAAMVPQNEEPVAEDADDLDEILDEDLFDDDEIDNISDRSFDL